MIIEGFGTERSHPDPNRLLFSISKLFLFKKLNGGRVGMRKFSNPPRLYLIFVFIFYFKFFIFVFFIFIILKLIYFIKNKNIMNFYKLFIKKHSNYYYYLYSNIK